jgi:hypothetical protein
MDGAPVNDVKEGSAPAAQAQAEHSTPQTEPRAPESQPDLNIKFTPESQQGLHELEALLQGPAGLSQLQSQEPLMQTQDCSLQQEMLQAEHNSTERDQNRAQQAAAALRGEAAAGNSAAGVLAGADGGLEPDEAATMAALHAAAAAAAAAGGSAQGETHALHDAQQHSTQHSGMCTSQHTQRLAALRFVHACWPLYHCTDLLTTCHRWTWQGLFWSVKKVPATNGTCCCSVAALSPPLLRRC